MEEILKINSIKQESLRNTIKGIITYGFEKIATSLLRENIFYDYEIYSKFENLIRGLEKVTIIAPFDAKNFVIADNTIYLANMEGILVPECYIKKNYRGVTLRNPALTCITCTRGDLKVDLDFFLKHNADDSEKTFYRCNYCGRLIDESVFKEKILKEAYI